MRVCIVNLFVGLAVVAFTLHSETASAQITISGFSSDGGNFVTSSDISSMFSSQGSGLPSNTSRLLQTPQIVKELGLQDNQIEAIKSLAKAMNKQISEVIQNVEFGDGDSGEIIREAQRKIRERGQEKLEEVLTPRQLERLNQIKIQSSIKSRGAMALMTGMLDEEIRLTDKQKTLLKTVNAKKSKELEEEIKRLKQKYFDATIDEVLNEKQASKLKGLMGESYEIKPLDFRGMFSQRRNSKDAEKAEEK